MEIVGFSPVIAGLLREIFGILEETCEVLVRISAFSEGSFVAWEETADENVH
jgi:hypothetical protein